MKNKHLPHIEDLLFTEGSTHVPLKILYNVYHFLNGECNDVNISTKWDGSPAFVCGIEPENKQFFLGTKGVFSGKVNYSHYDIDINHTDERLRKKLHILFNAFCNLKWDGVYQGDLLWYDDGCYCLNHTIHCQPNTLKYEIPVNGVPYLGAVLHTTYIGKTLKDMYANVGVKVPEHSDDIYLFEPSIKQPSGILSDNESEYLMLLFKNLFSEAKDLQEKYSLELYYLNYPNNLEKIQRYVNHCISDDLFINRFGFIEYQNVSFIKHLDSLKTEKGKIKAISLFKTIDVPEIIWEYYITLMCLKNYLITFLDTLDTHTKIYLPNGTRTSHEGYVIEYYPNVCKFVARDVFSKVNFSYKKDWQK